MTRFQSKGKGNHLSKNKGQPSAFNAVLSQRVRQKMRRKRSANSTPSNTTGRTAPVPEAKDDLFASVRGNCNSQLENQRTASDLLDATEQTLFDRQIPFLAVNYFEALFPMLDNGEYEQRQNMSPSRATFFNLAVIYLISFVAPHLPEEYLREKYAEIYARLPAALVRFESEGPFVRSTISLISSIISSCALHEKEAVEERSSLRELFERLVMFSVDARPKVRKQAQDALIKLDLRAALSQNRLHDDLVRDLAKVMLVVLSHANRKDVSQAVHALFGVRMLWSISKDVANAELCEQLLRCISLGNSHFTVLIYQLISQYPNISWSQLLQLRPDASQVSEIVPSYLHALVQSVLHLNQQEQAVGATVDLLISEYLCSVDAQVLEAVEVNLALLMSVMNLQSLQKSTEMMKKWLLIKNAVQAPVVIRLAREMIAKATINEDALLLWKNVLLSLVISLAEAHDGKQAKHASLIEACFGAAIQRFGVSMVLQAVPLCILDSKKMQESMKSDEDSSTVVAMQAASRKPRAWMLAVIREYASTSLCNSNNTLAYFCDELVPLADAVAAHVCELEEAGKSSDAKVYGLVRDQIWMTLPAFLYQPVDFEHFDRLAPLIAELISTDLTLRPVLISALTAFVLREQEASSNEGASSSSSIEDSGKQRSVVALQMFAQSSAPKFVPLLFNVYSMTASEQRGPVLEAIQAMLSLLPADQIVTYYDRIMSRLESDMADDDKAVSLIELLSVIALLLSLEHQEKLFAFALQRVSDGGSNATSITILKRLYRLMSDMLEVAESGAELFERNFDAIESALVNGGQSDDVPSAVRRSRFRLLLCCLSLCAASRQVNGLHWIPLLLPEVVFGVKEMNMRTRALAFDLLMVMAERMRSGGVISASKTNGMLPADTQASLGEFLTMLMAGLAARTPHMMSATIMCLARVIFDYADAMCAMSDEAAGTIVQALLVDMVALLESKSREVVKAVMGFLKVSIGVLPAQFFIENDASLLSQLLCNMLSWSGAHQMHFKERVKHMVDRCMRKYGVELVYSLTPAEHRPLVNAIRKQKEQTRRKKQLSQITGASGVMANEEKDHLMAVASSRLFGADSESTRSARFAAAMENDDDDDDASADEDEQAADSVLAEIGDLDDDEAIERVFSKRLNLHTAMKRRRTEDNNDDDEEVNSQDEAVRFDDQGNLVVVEDDATVSGKKTAAVRQANLSIDDFEEEGLDIGDDEDARAMSSMGKKRRAVAGGDFKKRNDKFEPYAYVPMVRGNKKSKSNFFMKRR